MLGEACFFLGMKTNASCFSSSESGGTSLDVSSSFSSSDSSDSSKVVSWLVFLRDAAAAAAAARLVCGMADELLDEIMRGRKVVS